jgi:putative acetyltransferase
VKIRAALPADNELLAELWLAVTVRSQNFIEKNYWISQKSEMIDKYLPMAETWILENDGKIAGFVSMEDNFLDALFIKSEEQRKGYGKALLDHVKKNRDFIDLKVYTKNQAAQNFYAREGFIVVNTGTNQETHENEYLLRWNRKKA